MSPGDNFEASMKLQAGKDFTQSAIFNIIFLSLVMNMNILPFQNK
jgi:hypothetical protein